jgi:hypothetical protein
VSVIDERSLRELCEAVTEHLRGRPFTEVLGRIKDQETLYALLRSILHYPDEKCEEAFIDYWGMTFSGARKRVAMLRARLAVYPPGVNVRNTLVQTNTPVLALAASAVKPVISGPLTLGKIADMVQRIGRQQTQIDLQLGNDVFNVLMRELRQQGLI